MENKTQASMSVNASLLREVHVAFLRKKNERPSDKMRTAFEMCTENEDVNWLCVEDVDYTSRKDIVFVCDEFKGETFERLKRINARIIGPQCVITCIQKDEDVPILPYPIYTATMKGLEVCCTNVSRSVREQLHETVKLMGGVIHREFSIRVTHLVAGEVGSKKYLVACNNKKPVMLPEWVEECWKVGQIENIYATDERFLIFRCPIFKGLQITVSQLDSKERKKVQKLIESNGGSYSGSLQVHSTTHLVCLEPTGEKYKVAKQKSICCVKKAWIYDSIQKGYCLNGSLYSFENVDNALMLSASTPNSKAKVSHPVLPDASIITDNISKTAVNETAVSNSSVLNNSSKSTVPADGSLISNKHSDASILKRLEDFHYNSYGQFLDGCKILLSGFSPTLTEHLRRVLNVGGATRFSQLNDNVSHVILGSATDEHYKILLDGKFRPHVVNIEWLFACMKEGRPVEEKDYYCSNLSSIQVPVSPFAKSHVKEKESVSSVVALQVKDSKPSNNEEEEMDEVMHQYLINGQNDASAVFCGLTFSTSHSDGINDEITSIIVQYGGKITCSSDVDVDYVVVPILGLSSIKNRRCVTPYWIESCIEAEMLLDESSNPLFKPIYVDAKVQPLKGCVLSLSQFSSLERDYLVQISVSLGAKYQEYFARQTNHSRGVLACTHLVSKIPDGSKYVGAIKWGVPIVTMKWLLKCAETSSKVSEESYLLGESTISKGVESKENYVASDLTSRIKDANTLSNNDVPSIPSDSTTLTPASFKACPPTNEKLYQIRERIRGGYQTPSLQVSRIKKLFYDEQDSPCNTSCESPQLTPGKLLNPDNIKKINIRDAMASLDSPANDRTSAVSPTSKLTIEDLFGLKIKQAIKHELKADDGIVKRNEYDDSPEKNDIMGPLNGLVIVVSKKLSHQQSELNKIVESLGGKFRWKYDKSCTHFIHQGKSNDFSKEVKSAKDDGKYLVSPQWLRDCLERKVRLDESRYPYTYNPQMSLNVSTEAEASDNKKHVLDLSSKSVSNAPVESSQTAEIRETAHRKIDEILAATKVAKDKRITKRYISKTNISSSGDGNKKPLQRPRGGAKKDSETDNPEPVESLPITWDDPTSRLEREKLAAHLAKDSQSMGSYPNFEEAEDIGNNISDEKLSKELEAAIDEKSKPVPKIMLAGFSTNERGMYNGIIQTIGGIVINSPNFDITCTHLIAGNPSRTEKYLASLASGKWVLQPSYLTDSEKAGHFLKEEDYEWGRNDADHVEFLSRLNSDQQKLARAAHIWRTRFQEEKSALPPEDHCTVGAYKNWNAIICTNEQRSSSFRRLLEAGAAHATCITTSPFKFDGITHAFMELTKIPATNIDLNAFVKSGILCLKPDYLGYYLVEEDSESNLSNYYLPEVLPLLASLPQHDSLALKRKSREKLDTGKRVRQ